MIGPLIKPIWYRILTRIRGMSSGGASPETPATRSSPAARLPLEVVEIVTAHLTYDTPSLRACALTCYSWYIAAVPHLQHTFTTGTYSHAQNFEWSNPLHHTQMVGLLPLEVVEMIIAHLIYDLPSLRACALTCYSWYIAAVPHLHHTLTIYFPVQTSDWSGPLQRAHVLGLLPLVKRLRVHGRDDDHAGLSPALFNCRILRQFFALSNVQELEIEYLDIPNFMPRIQRYFRNFLPTVRSLSLREPRGSHRQIIYFIGLFQHLQDLKLVYAGFDRWQKTANDPALFPPFIPPLRGRLTVAHFTETGFLREMINLFGGIRFSHMILFDVDGVRLLLDAGAESLECVKFFPFNSQGEQYFLGVTQVPVNSFAARSSPRDFDLSRNKSLRRLQVPASSIGCNPVITGLPNGVAFLKHVLSTIASPVILEVIIVYSDIDFCCIGTWNSDRPYLCERSQAGREYEASWHHRLFGALREVHKVRAFRPVLCANVSGCLEASYMVQTLEEAVAEEKARGGFEDFLFDPLVEYHARGFSPQKVLMINGERVERPIPIINTLVRLGHLR